ncbi:unnamed protein product, partial [Prorocentrum cordatum]
GPAARVIVRRSFFAAAQASPVAPERFSAPAFSEKTARAGAAEKGEDGGRKRRRTTRYRARGRQKIGPRPPAHLQK